MKGKWKRGEVHRKGRRSIETSAQPTVQSIGQTQQPSPSSLLPNIETTKLLLFQPQRKEKKRKEKKRKEKKIRGKRARS